MINSNFKITLELRIDWSELDYFGHVNNVSFFKYIQAARVNYWDQTGISGLHKETNTGPMLASCKCDFKAPLFYPGKVIIASSIDYIKNTSFSIIHTISNEEGALVAEAQDVMVMFDFNKNEKVSFPESIKKTIELLEDRKY